MQYIIGFILGGMTTLFTIALTINILLDELDKRR